MRQFREGGCQCGALRYRIGESLKLAACHCTDCQRQSGSAFGLSLAVAAAQFELLRGELKSFSVTCDSGRVKQCSFCPECGTRIHHRTDDAMLSIKAGTLDDPSALVPEAHYWVKHKLAWLALPPGVPAVSDDG